MGELYNKRVLVIEDDNGLRFVLDKFLGHFFQVTSLANGHEALSWIAKKKPDLVVTDLDMPVINGIQLLKILRSSLVYKEIKIIVVSGYDNIDFRKVCMDYSVLNYFVKPFNPIELVLFIYSVFKVSSAGNKQIEKLMHLA